MNNDFEKLLGRPKYIANLIKYMKRRLKGRVDPIDIESVCSSVQANKINTAEALEMLRSKASDQQKDASVDTYRANARVRDLSSFNIKNVKKYVDIGCGNGVITEAIGRNVLKLEKSDIIGTDISFWAGHNHASEVSEGITFIEMKDPSKLDIESNSIDLVTTFMALHHMSDEIQTNIINEIRRILKPGGLLLIREHDCPNKLISSMINIEHALYEVVLEKLSDAKTFQDTFVGQYRPIRSWTTMFSDMGFSPAGQPVRNLKNYTRPFYQMYRNNAESDTIDSRSIPKLRALARSRGITVKGSSGHEALKRAILSGRRPM